MYRPGSAVYGYAQCYAAFYAVAGHSGGIYAQTPCYHTYFAVIIEYAPVDAKVTEVPHHGCIVALVVKVCKHVWVHAPPREHQYQALRALSVQQSVFHCFNIVFRFFIASAGSAAERLKRRRSVPGGTVGVRIGNTL